MNWRVESSPIQYVVVSVVSVYIVEELGEVTYACMYALAQWKDVIRTKLMTVCMGACTDTIVTRCAWSGKYKAMILQVGSTFCQ